MSLAMAIWVMSLGAYIYGAFLLLFTFLSAMLFFWWRSRIPFGMKIRKFKQTNKQTWN